MTRKARNSRSPARPKPLIGIQGQEDSVVDPVWTVYFDGRPTEISRASCGYRLEEWLEGGKDFFKRVATVETVASVRAAIHAVRTRGRSLHNIEIEFVGKEPGRRFHFLVNYHPVFNAAGDVIGVRGDARDVTELMQFERALGRGAGLLVSLVESTGDLFWAFYFDGRSGFASRDCCGFDRREWATGGLQLLRERLTDYDRRRFDNALDFVRKAKERAINLPLHIKPKHGRQRRRFLANAVPLFDRSGDVVGVYCVMHDVTELTDTRAALKRSDARFRDMIEFAHDLVWQTDGDHRWTYVNPAARQIYGGDPAELLGQSFLDRSHSDHRARDAAALQQVANGKDLFQYETVHLRIDGTPRHLSMNLRPQIDDAWRIVGAVGMARDITDQKNYQEQIEHLADHDAMTDLFNRHYFERQLNHSVATAKRNQRVYGLLYVDLDNFKYVNDTLGHAAGDRLLLETARVLKGRLRQGDVLARFGGDEFTVLLQDMTHERLRYVAHEYCELFGTYSFLDGGQRFDIRVSIGAALLDGATGSASDVMAHADLACSNAKTRGRNQFYVYDPTDRALDTMVQDVGWSRQLNDAIAHDRFELLFQPIMRLRDATIEHYEVLLRLRGKNDELIAPGAFLSPAERFGLIHSIDRWVVEHALARLALLRSNGQTVRFAINLSGRAFEDTELLPTIERALTEYSVDPAAVTFEVTETAAIARINDAKIFIARLKTIGCQFALDDFGSGFSSYSYLKFLPADYLKIDGAFVQGLADDPLDQAIVQSMNQVAHASGKETIAEFVEDARSLELLRDYGVDFAQGYYIGRPSESLVRQV